MKLKSVLLILIYIVNVMSLGTSVLKVDKKQLLVPLKFIETSYKDNSTTLPVMDYSDQYYAQVADQIVFKELSKRFQNIELLTDTTDIRKLYETIQWNKDSARLIVSSEFAKICLELSTKYKTDNIVMPEFCVMTYKQVHQSNWRDGRGGSSYERPVSVRAFSEFSIAFFQKDGTIIRSSKGNASFGKPLFYKYARKKNFDANIVENSKKKYAPPLLRALNRSIVDAFGSM
jgi:hypothetical protein